MKFLILLNNNYLSFNIIKNDCFKGEEGKERCIKNIIYKCEELKWKSLKDCSKEEKTCGLIKNQYICINKNEHICTQFKKTGYYRDTAYCNHNKKISWNCEDEEWYFNHCKEDETCFVIPDHNNKQLFFKSKCIKNQLKCNSKLDSNYCFKYINEEEEEKEINNNKFKMISYNCNQNNNIWKRKICKNNYLCEIENFSKNAKCINHNSIIINNYSINDSNSDSEEIEKEIKNIINFKKCKLNDFICDQSKHLLFCDINGLWYEIYCNNNTFCSFNDKEINKCLKEEEIIIYN